MGVESGPSAEAAWDNPALDPALGKHTEDTYIENRDIQNSKGGKNMNSHIGLLLKLGIVGYAAVAFILRIGLRGFLCGFLGRAWTGL